MLALRWYLRWGMQWIGDLCVKIICHRLSCNFVDIKFACLDTKHFSSQTRHWPWEHWPYLQATMYYLAYSINTEKFLLIRKVNFIHQWTNKLGLRGVKPLQFFQHPNVKGKWHVSCWLVISNTRKEIIAILHVCS